MLKPNANRIGGKRVLSAVDLIIKDTDKKYDECLVEHFLSYLKSRSTLYSDRKWIILTRPILDRLKLYTDHDAFVMLNQARAFKTFQSVIGAKKSLSEQEFKHVLPMLDSIWNTIDMMMINQNLAAMTVLLSIFNQLIDSSVDGYFWLVKKKIEPPLELDKRKKYNIHDVTSLVRYYFESSNNYHTKNKADLLFQNLVKFACFVRPQTVIIRNTIKELMEEGSKDIIILLDKINQHESRTDLIENLDILDIVQNGFLAQIENGNVSNKMCLCLARLEPCEFVNERIRLLKSKNNIEGLVTYLVGRYRWDKKQDTGLPQLLNSYLFYPLLARCKGDETEAFVQKIMITREERDFIDKNSSDKLITLCLKYLQSFDGISDGRRNLMLPVEILLHHIKSNYNSLTSYKNNMECCFLIKCLSTPQPDLEHRGICSFEILEDMHKIIETNEHSDERKPILLEILEMMRIIYKNVRNSTDSRLKLLFERTVDLAFLFQDDDVIYAFAQIFSVSKKEFKQSQTYVKLIWEHMYLNSKSTSHQELLASLASLLLEINKDVDAEVLEVINIRKNRDPTPTAQKAAVIKLSSYVDDILNYNLLTDGISDCY